MSFFLTGLVIALFLLVCAFFAGVIMIYALLWVIHGIDLGGAYLLSHALGWISQGVTAFFRW